MHFVFVGFYKSGPHFDEVDDSFRIHSVYFSISSLWEQADEQTASKDRRNDTDGDGQSVLGRPHMVKRQCVKTKARGRWHDCFWLQQLNTQLPTKIIIYNYTYLSLSNTCPLNTHTHKHIHTYFPSLSKVDFKQKADDVIIKLILKSEKQTKSRCANVRCSLQSENTTIASQKKSKSHNPKVVSKKVSGWNETVLHTGDKLCTQILRQKRVEFKIW